MPDILSVAVTPEIGAGATRQFTARVRRVEFGDGYAQRTRHGIALADLSLAVTWRPLDQAQMQALLDFLEARGGAEAFFYAMPEMPAELFTCDSWSDNEFAPGSWSVSATLRRENDL